MKFVDICAPACAAIILSCTVVFAQDAVEMRDANAKFTMQLGGKVAWSVDTDLTGKQSSVVAVSPDGHEPFMIVSATTYLKVNPMAIMGGSITQKTTEGFLEGACHNFNCADISARSYEDIGDMTAWVVTTMLNLPAYDDLGAPEAVMIATASPQGYMQLFSLHTAEGKADEMKPMFLEAVKSVQYEKE